MWSAYKYIRGLGDAGNYPVAPGYFGRYSPSDGTLVDVGECQEKPRALVLESPPRQVEEPTEELPVEVVASEVPNGASGPGHQILS